MSSRRRSNRLLANNSNTSPSTNSTETLPTLTPQQCRIARSQDASIRKLCLRPEDSLLDLPEAILIHILSFLVSYQEIDIDSVLTLQPTCRYGWLI
jgi:hypothetical protein